MWLQRRLRKKGAELAVIVIINDEGVDEVAGEGKEGMVWKFFFPEEIDEYSHMHNENATILTQSWCCQR